MLLLLFAFTVNNLKNFRVVLDMTSKNKSFPFCIHGCSALADTTNNIILGPQQDINAIHTLIKAKSLLFGRFRVRYIKL